MKITRGQNFISVDGRTVRTSYDEFFTVGEIVGHDGANNHATILSFQPEVENNEILVRTTKGTAHIDFLVKVA